MGPPNVKLFNFWDFISSFCCLLLASVWWWCKLNIYPPSAQSLLTMIMKFPNFPTPCPTKDIFHKLSRPGKRPLSFPKFMTTVRTLLKIDISVQIEPFSFRRHEDRGKRKYSSFCIVDCGKRNDTFCDHSSQCKYQEDSKHASSYFVLLPWLSQEDPWRGMLGGRATLNTINTTGNNNGNNNNRLFMVPHFIWALTKTKHNYVHITHTHTLQIHVLLVMGWYAGKKTTDQYAEEKNGLSV